MNDSDFIGFSFNGIHSDTLHIKRVSDGSRYSENLSPNFQDVKAQVPGRDGSLYWDSFYSEKTFPVQIAFDDLSEVGLRTLKQTFNGKAEGWLKFDEAPYKQYWVKVQNPVQLKYLCFYDENNNRVYKGEGTINLVAYDVYGHCDHRFLNSYTNSNINEWKAASGLKPSEDPGSGPAYEQSTGFDGTDYMRLYNGGDLPADPIIWVPSSLGPDDERVMDLREVRLYTTVNSQSTLVGRMIFDPIEMVTGDFYLQINPTTELIEGISITFEPTGHLYNKYLTGGQFIKVPADGNDYRLYTYKDQLEILTGTMLRKYDFLYY